MSQTLLFEFGAVIFLAVSTAVFLYGLVAFRDWEHRDDVLAEADELVRVEERSLREAQSLAADAT
jgi:hypothetical protein